jgi:hypothetical protein
LVAVERRLRLLALTRGVAATTAAALVFTVVAVVLANHYAFSKPSVVSARLLLFFGLAFAIAAALVMPILRLNRRRAAREAESKYPQFQERLLTLSEKMEQNPNDPFLHLLADDALTVAREAEPREVAKTSSFFRFSSAAAISFAVLLWLGLSGPGFLGYGTSLLWGGLPKGKTTPYYDIEVQPGNHTVRKRADEIITATLHGFTAPQVRFFGKYASSSQWEQTEMRTQPNGTAYELVFPGISESLEYYVEAGGVRSKTYKLTVKDLPAVKGIVTTYHYPAWTGMKDFVENPGGDLRAVEGTTATIEIKTDKPLGNGVLMMDDGSKLALRSTSSGTLVAQVPIQRDGQYHIAAVEDGDDVRLTEDYFIESQKDKPPEIKLTKPGRDFRASPIEEVTVTAEATDDFGLKDIELHYSVNGGPEKVASVLQNKGVKSATGSMTIALEDYKAVPGDVVSLYAVAKDARDATRTDMYFIEAQPFERNFSQSQQGGGGGGGGGGQQDDNQISQRQKEIIAATWNQAKGTGAKGSDAENAQFLSQVQGKLRDQAKSLADRMKARQLSEEGDSFKTFAKDMEDAVNAMGPASDKLKSGKWLDALGPEQQALQHLLHAESTRRDIQVAFGNRGGGGGGGGQGGARDLEGLFDLELDTEKNQFESGQQQASAGQQQQEIDDIMQKLEQLARRQQELANQQRNNQTLSQKRYEQDQLRREAEQLQKQLDQLTKQMQSQQGQQGQQQQGQQQGGQQQSGQQAQGQQSGQQQGQMGRTGGMDSQQLRQTLDRLQQAVDNMRKAESSQQAGTPQSDADARKAADLLRDAQQKLADLRNQQSSGKVEDLAREADELAQRQRDFEGQLRRSVTGQGQNGQRGMTREQAQQLYEQRQKELGDVKRLESQMQNAVREMAGSQAKASAKLREALGEMQQQEIPRDMEMNGEYIRRGLGEYAAVREPTITQGLNQLRDQLKGVQQLMGDSKDAKDGKGGASDKENKAVEQALGQVERLRQQLEQLQRQSGQQGRNGQNQNGQGQRQQGSLQRGDQPGQQQGGQQQGGQQQGGGQQAGGQQQGGQQANGRQQGGPNGGNYGVRNGNQWGPVGGLGTNDPNLGYYNGVEPRTFERDYRNTLEQLQQLQGQLQSDPQTAKDLAGLIREMQRLNPFTYANDPELSERIQAAMVADIQQVEMELRRKVDETGGGSIRSGSNGRIPQGYADPVAEYFRRLAKSK